MPTFRFRFEPLLSLQRRRRDEIGGEVGKATEAIRRVDEQIDLLKRQRSQIRAQTTAQFAGGGSSDKIIVSVDSMLQAGRYDLQLAGEALTLASTRQTLELELHRRRGLLIEAEMEVKRLERLRASLFQEHTQTILQSEQAQADDLSTARKAIADRRIKQPKQGLQL